MTEAASGVSPVRSERPALELAAAARQPVDAVLQELGSTQTGLTSDEADGRLRTVGPNVLAPIGRNLGKLPTALLACLLRLPAAGHLISHGIKLGR